MLSLKKLSHLLHGFTLVELIVVISVLAVLATIAMSQVSNITAWARDSQRMTDMSSMKSSIELYKAKTGKLPIPTNGSGVTYSWGLLWIQGAFGESVTREIKSITPKPIDPINKIEYVYSIANNNREFELGGILERATGLVPSILLNEVFAASQNVTFIEWTYNGISLKVETGSKTYIVAAPSIVASTLGTTIETTLLSIDWLWSLPQWFSWTTTSTAQTGTFTPIIAWSGSKLPDTSTGAQAMIQWLQNAYSWTKATTLSQISSLISATGSQITALGQGLIQNSLGGTAITLPVTTNTGTGETPPATPETDPYASSVVSLLHFDGNLNDERGKIYSSVSSTSTSTIQKKFGNGALSLNWSSQYLTTPIVDDYIFGSTDFTIDVWVYTNQLSSWQAIIGQQWSSGVGQFVLYINDQGKLWFLVSDITTSWKVNTYSSNSIPLSTWTHVAAIRSGNDFYVAINGIVEKIGTISIVLPNTWQPVRLWVSWPGFDINFFNGYIDELRVTKWVARWTSNFTPPTAPTTIPTTVGYSASNPGTTCKALYDAGVRADGTYWIKPDANAAFKAYCDMTTDGGGWTLAANMNYASVSTNTQTTDCFSNSAYCNVLDKITFSFTNFLQKWQLAPSAYAKMSYATFLGNAGACSNTTNQLRMNPWNGGTWGYNLKMWNDCWATAGWQSYFYANTAAAFGTTTAMQCSQHFVVNNTGLSSVTATAGISHYYSSGFSQLFVR